jgi:hypothetical protein
VTLTAFRNTRVPDPPKRPRRSYPVEMATFHAEDYVDFLSKITRLRCRSTT